MNPENFGGFGGFGGAGNSHSPLGSIDLDFSPGAVGADLVREAGAWRQGHAATLTTIENAALLAGIAALTFPMMAKAEDLAADPGNIDLLETLIKIYDAAKWPIVVSIGGMSRIVTKRTGELDAFKRQLSAINDELAKMAQGGIFQRGRGNSDQLERDAEYFQSKIDLYEANNLTSWFCSDTLREGFEGILAGLAFDFSPTAMKMFLEQWGKGMEWQSWAAAGGFTAIYLLILYKFFEIQAPGAGLGKREERQRRREIEMADRVKRSKKENSRGRRR